MTTAEMLSDDTFLSTHGWDACDGIASVIVPRDGATYLVSIATDRTSLDRISCAMMENRTQSHGIARVLSGTWRREPEWE